MNPRREMLLMCCLTLYGCAMTPAKSQQAPLPGLAAVEDESAMKAALEDLQKQKAAMAVPRANSNCRPLCQIGELVCAASDRICQIASRHPDRIDYGERCRCAEQDCRAAQRECETCQ